MCSSNSYSIWFFFPEGRHIQYAKISQIVKETFNQLISNHSEYLKCSNSLAAFIIERGKSQVFDLVEKVLNILIIWAVNSSVLTDYLWPFLQWCSFDWFEVAFSSGCGSLNTKAFRVKVYIYISKHVWEFINSWELTEFKYLDTETKVLTLS